MYGLYDQKRLEKKGLLGKLPLIRLYGLYKKIFEYLELEYRYIPEKIPAYAGIFLTGGTFTYRLCEDFVKIVAIIVLLIFCAYTILSMRPARAGRGRKKKRANLADAFMRGFTLALNNFAINLDEIEHLQFLVRVVISLVLMSMML